MNPSFPGASGDRHGQPPSALSAASAAMGKSGQGPHPGQHGQHPQHPQHHAFHTQPPLTQLAHSGHHQGLHPLHGGSHTSSLLDGGPGPRGPSLPPPPLSSSLGPSASSRSPHHSLTGSLLHPPRTSAIGGLTSSTKTMASLSSLGGAGGSSGGQSGGPSVGGLMNHSVRMAPPQNQQPNSGNPNANAPGGDSSFMRPNTPPRRQMHDGGGPMNTSASSNQQGQQQNASKPQYGMDRTGPSNQDPEGKYYHAPPLTKLQPMAPPPQPRHRELRVEDALLYLDQVKQQFGDQPDIYNQFLDVMKEFKAQAIDTPGVILRVSNLFRGYPNLILGFNTFLPPGYRIRPDNTIEMAPMRPSNQSSMYSSSVQAPTSAGQPSPNANVSQPYRPPPVSIPAAYSPSGLPGSHHPGAKLPTPRQPMSSAQPASQSKSMMQGQPKQGPTKKQNAPASKSTSQSSTNPVEFDHAIHYVTTIKQRFADEPDTYKAFLEILHTYQKEQRSIRQVLDQVSFLFRDHPDLLREFTFFLPDAVQKQAKERLHRAAEKAQLRKDRMAASAQSGGYRASGREGSSMIQPSSSSSGSFRRTDDSKGMSKPPVADDMSPSSVAYKPGNRADDMELEDSDRLKVTRNEQSGIKSPREVEEMRRAAAKAGERREKDRERNRNKALFAHKRAKRRAYDGKERRDFLALSDVVIGKEEWALFERIKRVLPSKDNWREFLKCLELYSQEVLGREEMISLIKNLFGRHTDLVEDFDRMLTFHGEKKNPKEVWPFIPLAETDLSQCRRATPSYRALPESYPIAPCSARTKHEQRILNDRWVSVPTGSEEDFSFKHMRKNQYEEALFKCEDERFEIDMVIDANMCTISILEPLAREIEALKDTDGSEEKLWNYVVEKGTFRTTHLNAISRIYGDAGAQILDLLRKYPAGAIPVILKRLKQKDEEWRRARQDLNKQWKEVNENNYHKSLDHSSFYFKQKDKKQTSMKVLLQEAKKKLEEQETVAAEASKAKQTTQDKSKQETKEVESKGPENSVSIKDETPSPDSTENVAAIAGVSPIKTEMNVETSSKPADVTNDTDVDMEALPTTTSETVRKPHFVYKFSSVQIHKDAFGLLCYAAEKSLGTADKEKVARIWQSFFLPFFRLEEEWLTRKPKRTNLTIEKAKALRPGTEVSTYFGEGTLHRFDTERGVVVVNLLCGHAYLQPDAVTIQETSDFPPNIDVLDEEKSDSKAFSRKSVFFGGQHAYAFLRLYQMLHNRLERAYELCEKAKRMRSRRTINPAARALAHSRHTTETTGKDNPGDYQAFLSKLYLLIDGSVDNTKYEDCCRSLMGSTSYFLFTMDKLVSLILKQMQHLGADSTSQELLKLFGEQNDSPVGPTDIAGYLSKTKGIYEGEGAFRMEFKPGVLRRTPLEPNRVGTPKSNSPFDIKIWAPSPRVKQESNKWFCEPELSIEYLGSVDEDEKDEEEEDGDDSPAPTPPETPIATPLSDSPVRGTPKEGDNETGDSSEAFTDEDEEEGRALKKRSRSESVEEEKDNSTASSPTSKKPRVQETEEDDDEEEDEPMKSENEDDHGHDGDHEDHEEDHEEHENEQENEHETGSEADAPTVATSQTEEEEAEHDADAEGEAEGGAEAEEGAVEMEAEGDVKTEGEQEAAATKEDGEEEEEEEETPTKED